MIVEIVDWRLDDDEKVNSLDFLASYTVEAKHWQHSHSIIHTMGCPGLDRSCFMPHLVSESRIMNRGSDKRNRWTPIATLFSRVDTVKQALPSM
jgi:hypothetical protein